MRRLVAVAVAVVAMQSSVAADEPGFVVAATEGNVWETSIAISPADPKNAVAIGVVAGRGPNTVQPFYTNDSGLTWHYGGKLGLQTAKRTYSRHGDPVVASDRHGVMYAATLIGHPQNYPLTYSGIGVFRSSDNGKTWDGPYGVVERAPTDKPFFADDKEWIGVDATGGPHDGSVYVSWLRSDTGNTQRIEAIFARSTDGGVTWGEEQVLGPGGGAQISIGPAGDVHVLRTCGDGYYCSQVSRDGGATFAAPVRIAQSATFLSNAVDTSNGPHRGNVYMAWIASITGPQLSRSWVGTVYFTRSTDGGRSWAAPAAITPVSSGTALFQTLACDPVTGDVVLTWLDRRENPAAKKFRLMMTRSTDGGRTFSPHAPLTAAVDMTASPTTTFIGDYNTMAGHGGVYLSAFSDGLGRMSVARFTFAPPPPPGPKRRSARH